MEAIGEEMNDGGGGANHVELDGGAHVELDGGAQEVNDGEIADGEGDDFDTVGPILVAEDDIPSEVDSLRQWLRSEGYEEDDISKLVRAQAALLFSALELNRCTEGPLKEDEHIHAMIQTSRDSNDDSTVLREDFGILRPEWELLVQKLSAVPAHKRGYICLSLSQLQLGSDLVSDIMPAFQTAPLLYLQLTKNSLESDSDGMAFVLEAVRTTSTLERLVIESNPLRPEDMLALTKVVREHPRLDNLMLKRCGMDRDNTQISQAIVDVLQNLKIVTLDGNSLGSRSAKLISACLSKNPIVERLELEDNQLGDDDALCLAKSLLSNDNLQVLRLVGNQITQKGFYWLKRAIFFNAGPLDHIWQHSNHNCYIVSGEDTFSLVNNFYYDPDKNRKFKMTRCLPVATPKISHSSAITVMSNIQDIPLGIVPHIIVFVQRLESVLVMKGLDATFRLMKNWNMPLLYTSSAGPCPRRSNRIRAKKVAQLMGK
ncbi:hypothetical protein ACHAXT_003981 [Thalassiosira profunda]